MNSIVNMLLGRAGYRVSRVPPATSDPETDYINGGRVPWSRGYFEARERFIRSVIGNEELLQLFRQRRRLPDAFGAAVDERCVEFPWVFSRLDDTPGRLLDAGSALNCGFALDHPFARAKRIHVLTLSPERNCFWRRGVSYLYADLRDIPIRDGYYDTVVCMSTLEHIGLDNSWFGREAAAAKRDPEGFVPALREMRRVLKPGGRLLTTVPFGRYRDFGSFQQFDKRLLDRAVAAFGPDGVESTYFCYTGAGWNLSTAEACAGAEYVGWYMAPADQRSAEFPDHPDRAAAARAVACLALRKPEGDRQDDLAHGRGPYSSPTTGST